MTVEQFLSLIDCDQAQDTLIGVYVGGKEIATETLEEFNSSYELEIKIQDLKIASFVFGFKCITILCYKD